MGPFSCRLTLADLFLDFLLLKVSLMIFQRKLLLTQWNMKSNYGYTLPTIIRYISSKTTPRLKLHMACYEVFLLRWIPRSIYNSGHLPCFNTGFVLANWPHFNSGYVLGVFTIFFRDCIMLHYITFLTTAAIMVICTFTVLSGFFSNWTFHLYFSRWDSFEKILISYFWFLKFYSIWTSF